MIIFKEFIWYKDHEVYHITSKENISTIQVQGLLPKLGERSISVGDKEKAIYFFDYLLGLETWMDALDRKKDKNSLEVLRFNLKRRKWYMHNGGEDFYLKTKVPANKLECLRLFDSSDNTILFSELQEIEDFNILKYKWIPLVNYLVEENTRVLQR